jgi:hypothetical protein
MGTSWPLKVEVLRRIRPGFDRNLPIGAYSFTVPEKVKREKGVLDMR